MNLLSTEKWHYIKQPLSKTTVCLKTNKCVNSQSFFQHVDTALLQGLVIKDYQDEKINFSKFQLFGTPKKIKDLLIKLFNLPNDFDFELDPRNPNIYNLGKRITNVNENAIEVTCHPGPRLQIFAKFGKLRDSIFTDIDQIAHRITSSNINFVNSIAIKLTPQNLIVAKFNIEQPPKQANVSDLAKKITQIFQSVNNPYLPPNVGSISLPPKLQVNDQKEIPINIEPSASTSPLAPDPPLQSPLTANILKNSTWANTSISSTNDKQANALSSMIPLIFKVILLLYAKTQSDQIPKQNDPSSSSQHLDTTQLLVQQNEQEKQMKDKFPEYLENVHENIRKIENQCSLLLEKSKENQDSLIRIQQQIDIIHDRMNALEKETKEAIIKKNRILLDHEKQLDKINQQLDTVAQDAQKSANLRRFDFETFVEKIRECKEELKRQDNEIKRTKDQQFDEITQISKLRLEIDALIQRTQ